MAWTARQGERESPLEVVVAYLLVLIAEILMLGAGHGLWLLVARIF